MKIVAINGSPRKGWNTHLLLLSALEGAANKVDSSELIHLGELNYRGCTGCLSCKLKGSNSVGSCVLLDDLKPVLERIDECDLLLIGSPLYFSEVTGMTRSFIERLLFRSINYDKQGSSIRKKRTPTLLIYTANMPISSLRDTGMLCKLNDYEQLFEQVFGPAKTMLSTETLQTEDYDAYHMAFFDAQERRERRKTVFPLDCLRVTDLTLSLLHSPNDSIAGDLDQGELI